MMIPDKDIVAISTIYRKTNIWKNEQSLPLGLTAAQVPIVILTCKKKGISQNEVVEELSLEKSVIAKSIGKLIKNGYITREQNSKDKRAFNLFPTDKAEEVYPKLVKQGKDCMNRLTTGMTNEERKILSELLGKMIENAFTQF